MQQLAQFLQATGRRLHILAKVICHFFRKGKLGMKIAITIPFFVEVEINFETDWDRRGQTPSRPGSPGRDLQLNTMVLSGRSTSGRDLPRPEYRQDCDRHEPAREACARTGRCPVPAIL